MPVVRSLSAIPLILLAAVEANALIVPGDANPNLAGRAGGYSCCGGDTAPAQRPIEMTEIQLSDCAFLHFAVSGRVSVTETVPPGNNPDGDNAFEMTNYGDGISAPTSIRDNALVGVFLDDSSPTGSPTPDRLSNEEPPLFLNSAPLLGQIFFIGDGRTGDSRDSPGTGIPQNFLVPNGSTRLYLGTTDGFGWANNSGSFTVTGSDDANPFHRPCGDAIAPEGISASDALVVLRTAVGATACDHCVCDVDHSSVIVTTDALLVLRRAVGQAVEMRCACCLPF